MAYSTQDLIDLARCPDQCIPKGSRLAVQIAAACAWNNAGGCTLPNKATTPSPANGATNLSPISVTLSWVDVGGSTRFNVWLNGSFLGQVFSPSISAGALAYGSSYSWRVDSVNACGVTTGDTWTFTTEIAPPAKAITPNPANGATGVSKTPTLTWANGGGATSYDVYFNGSFIGNQAGLSYIPGTLANSTAYSWRIDAVNSTGTTTGDVWTFTTIVAAPSKATTPSPANGASGVTIYGPSLSWVNGGGATGYDVWFNGSKVSSNQAGTTYGLGTLSFNTVYSWRIDSINAGGTTTGDPWSFTTLGPFAYAPSTGIITWDDMNAPGQSGNLAFFNSNADLTSVTHFDLNGQSLTSISNLSALPVLSSFEVSTNSLTVLDLTGCSDLTSVHANSNLLTTVDISRCPLLTTVDFQTNALTVAAVNSILSNLVSFGLAGGDCVIEAQIPAAPPSVGPPNGIVAAAALRAESPPWAVLTD